MDIIVSNTPEGGFDNGELEGAAVLGEVIIRLVGGGVLTDRNAVVC